MNPTIEQLTTRATKEYAQASTETKTVLEGIFGKDLLSQDMTEIILSLEDALKWNGTDPNHPKFHSEDDQDNAEQELKEIAKALRNGRILDYGDKNQKKWGAWRIFVPGSGFRFGASNYDYTHSYTIVGPRLCTHDEKTILHLHTHPAFQPIWDRFLTQTVI